MFLVTAASSLGCANEARQDCHDPDAEPPDSVGISDGTLVAPAAGIMRCFEVALFGCLVLAGCGGQGTPASDAAVDGGGICQDLTRQATDYVATHQSCNVDGDCTGEAAFGFIYDTGSDVSCWPPVVISTDAASGFLSLMNQMFAARCTGPTRSCSALVPVARCNQHVCTHP